MPIIEIPDPELPLSQGDVLKDVRLFITKEAWVDAGGDSDRLTQKICMVISRPCVVGNKANGVVAAVERFSDRVPKEVQSFEDVLGFTKVSFTCASSVLRRSVSPNLRLNMPNFASTSERL